MLLDCFLFVLFVCLFCFLRLSGLDLEYFCCVVCCCVRSAGLVWTSVILGTVRISFAGLDHNL